MQNLHSLSWFLLTILSIISLTAFPFISIGSQLSAAPPAYKRLTSKRSFYQKPVHYLTVTKIKCIWDKYKHIEAIQITSSSKIYKANIYHNDCYLQLFVFKFDMNNSSFFEISTSSFKRYPLITPPLKTLDFLISHACIENVTSQ